MREENISRREESEKFRKWNDKQIPSSIDKKEKEKIEGKEKEKRRRRRWKEGRKEKDQWGIG